MGSSKRKFDEFNYKPLYYIYNDKKTCCICNEEKNIKEFNKLTRSKDGHKSQCRICQNKIGKKIKNKK